MQLEDILGRSEASFEGELEWVKSMLTGKRVLVTGGGGSIGSELCRQIANFFPRQLVILDNTEFFLYKLKQELGERFPKLNFVTILGDIRFEKKIEWLFKYYRPEVVFHAAAYKHVPIMEENPWEALRTNIRGTWVLAHQALVHGVERFVMISSDKAVNPSSVMGASKRVAEMVCQSLQKESDYLAKKSEASRVGGAKTKFSTVRFGNVLGSSGSVIPEFERQIAGGGPLLVTHPEITRYFMSIPEAVRLVLQAGAIGEGGEIFILDMGTPVKIADLAAKMITLAGLRVGEDIEIKYIGLRPGEKLYEELLVDEEHCLSTIHPLVKRAEAREVSSNFSLQLEELFNLTVDSTAEEVREILQQVVEEYQPMVLTQESNFSSKVLDLTSFRMTENRSPH